MSKVQNAINWMINLANDNSHGYDQIHRWGPDYDCSSAVITAYQSAGVPVKTNGASYTGNMYGAFIKSGFKDVTGSVDLRTGSGLVAGDVLLNAGAHTCMYIGGGRIVEASINEKGTATGGRTGDQTGNEIHNARYYNYPWNYALRYTEVVNIPVVPNGVYRLYDSQTGDHLFTAGHQEAVNAANGSYNYEGVAWKSGNGADVLRLYNKYTGEHLLTADEKEKNSLVNSGWTYEGVAFKAGTQIPVYRLYKGMHMYTINETEREQLKRSGWTDEGEQFKVN